MDSIAILRPPGLLAAVKFALYQQILHIFRQKAQMLAYVERPPIALNVVGVEGR